MKSKTQSATQWAKKDLRPCPVNKCKHQHIKGTGPCTETGCGCHGSYGKRASKGGR